MATVKNLSLEEEVDEILSDEWILGLFEVQYKLVLGRLPNNWMVEFDLHGVIVECLVHQWVKIIWIYERSCPPARIFYNFDRVDNRLVHKETQDKVVMMNIGVTKINFTIINFEI